MVRYIGRMAWRSRDPRVCIKDRHGKTLKQLKQIILTLNNTIMPRFHHHTISRENLFFKEYLYENFLLHITFCLSQSGIVNTEGEVWEEQRRFVLRKLRDFGFAKTSMEGMILEEVNSMLEWFRNTKGTPVSCHRIFNSAVVNSLWHIVSGEKSEWKQGCENNSEILKKSDLFMQ